MNGRRRDQRTSATDVNERSSNDNIDAGRGVSAIVGSVALFGSFKLDRANYSLLRTDQNARWHPVPIRRKAFDVLRYMVDNPGRLIAPDEFIRVLWPSIHVQQEVLKGHIMTIRTALGDDASAPRYVETVRGRGYRFIALPNAEAVGAAVAERLPGASWRLVGRGAATRELNALLSKADAGVSQIVFVTGEAGIGKTAFGNEFLKAVGKEAATIAVGRCFAGNSETDAYAPILELLKQLSRSRVAPQLIELLPVLAPTWLVQLSDLAGGDVAGDMRRDVFGSTPHRVNRELCDLLGALARETLLVLLIEDTHWADRATLDFLEAMAARAPQGRLMLLLTMRPPHRRRQVEDAWLMSRNMCLYKQASEIVLTAFREQDVEELLAGLAGVPAPHELTRQLHAHSEGNPLFLHAIYEHLLGEKQITHGPSGWRISPSVDELLPVPPTLGDLIAGEIEKLDERARSVLDAASLSEGPFVPLIYAAGSPLDDSTFEDTCEELLRTTALIRRGDVLTVAGGRQLQSYEFRHAFFRLVAYDRQSRGRRVEAHGRVGDKLVQAFKADENIASVAARHYLAAERWAEAIHYLQIAARNVMRRFSHREAAAALERALSLVSHLPAGERAPRQVELLEDLARIYVGGLDPRAADVYEKLADLSKRIGREDIHCRALLGRAFALAWNDCDSSMPIWQEAIDRSSTLADPIAQARIRSAAHGWRNWASGWSAEDAAGCERAIAELRDAGDAASLNAGLVDYTLILFPSARYLEAYETIASSFSYLTENGLDQRVDISLPLWIWRLGRPWSMMCAGRLRDALELFDSGISGLLANGEIGRAATLQFYKALCCIHATRYAEALQLCQEARSLFGKSGTFGLSPNEELIGAVVQGLAMVGVGRPAEAMQLLKFARRGISEKRTLSTWHWRMALEWGLVDACLALDHVDDAAEHGRTLRAYALATQETTWRVLAFECSARAALRLHDTVAARKYLVLGRQEASKTDVPLAAWRLDAVHSEFLLEAGEIEKAAYHSRLAKEGLLRIVTGRASHRPGRDGVVGANGSTDCGCAGGTFVGR